MAYLTNGHDIKLKNYYPKTALAGFGLLLFMGLCLLVLPATYYLGFFMVLFVLFGGAGFTLWKLNKELIKVYHLVKYDDEVYEWIERWEPRKNVEEGMSPAFFYKIKKELIPVIDFIDPTKPKPFAPFDSSFNTVQSMDIGRTTDQSSAKRMLQQGQSLWSKQEVRLITYLAILGGIMFGIIAITGGEAPPPEIIQ